MVKISAFFDHTVNILFYLGCVLIAFAFLSVVTEVIVRTFLNKSISWVTEVTEYFLVASACLGAAWVLKKEGHVALDVVLNLLSSKKRAALNTITSMLGAIVCGVIFWFGAVAVGFHIEKGTYMIEKALELPTATLLWLIPLGFFLLFIQFLRRAYKYLRLWRVAAEEERELLEGYEDII